MLRGAAHMSRSGHADCQVRQAWDSIQQATMAQSLRPEGFLFEDFAPTWGAKDEEALLLRRQGMVANPYGRLPRRRRKHFSKAWRLFACGVPNARFAEVHIDVGVAFFFFPRTFLRLRR